MTTLKSAQNQSRRKAREKFKKEYPLVKTDMARQRDELLMELTKAKREIKNITELLDELLDTFNELPKQEDVNHG